MLYTTNAHDVQEADGRPRVTLTSSDPDARVGHVEFGTVTSCVVVGPDRVMHRSFRTHPVVGMGMSPKPRDPEGACLSRFEAWLWLNVSEFTEQLVPGSSGQPQTVEVDRSWRARVPNVAIEFGWSDTDTRQWLDRLLDDGLIGPGLHEVLHTSIVRAYRPRRSHSLPSGRRSAVLAKTSSRCVYCAVLLTTAPDHPNTFQADHVLPVVRGGSDDIANLVPSCADCNAKKSAKTALRFMPNGGGDGAP